MKTMFIDLRRDATTVYRVTTQGSVYLVALYSDEGRSFTLLKGAPGTSKENVVVRDTEPRIGDDPLWSVPPAQWIGNAIRIATMITSEVRAVSAENDPAVVRAMKESSTVQVTRDAHREAKALVTGQSRRESDDSAQRTVPYPESHVEYAEAAASFLRAIVRRETLFGDVADEPLLRDRLRVALSDCALLLERLRQRGSP